METHTYDTGPGATNHQFVTAGVGSHLHRRH